MGNAFIQPFVAVRPRPELAARICAPPYDVVSTEEARRLAGENPLSFLRVSRPEIEFPDGTDPYAPEVYERGRMRFESLMRAGALFEEERPAFYVYRLRLGSQEQTGLTAVVHCEAYLSGDVRKHELTRPDKEDDRTRHIETLNAQTGPAYLIYRAQPALDALLADRTQAPPEIEFEDETGVRHSVWAVTEADGLAAVQQALERIPRLYIADGHHRTAAAARVYQKRHGAGRSGWFLAVLFPHNQLRILPYHRLVRDLNGLTVPEFLRRLASQGELGPGDGRPQRPHEVDVYVAGRWQRMRFRKVPDPDTDAVEALDVTLLQKQVLAPVLGIEDPRTSPRLEFVGGAAGPETLAHAVDSGRAACAFALHPTQMDELLKIADQGGILPPKSTWFHPKLRDGLFSHRL
ncbi:MAG: DUF1015 family protein [Verrucomicrobiota bacterium]|nr:DUF1015 family protein [Limisphaera sp.]MDW8382606.1 DUF1015 family protein [Verrucomicrobiota bacterium]